MMFRSHLVLVSIVAFILCPQLTLAISRPGMLTGRCSLTFFSKMRAYDCVGLNLSEVPTYLPSNTEILDVSFNRIRQLTNTSFKNLSNLKKLYLNDNMILTIDAGTFDYLDDLETLDMSMNALIEVPVAIFHMNSLEKLMLSRNMLLNIVNLLEKAVPVTAPIKYLDISYSPMLTQLPELGVMMDLVHLNVTGNYITNVSIANFVGLCNLKYFTNDNTSIEFNSVCDCNYINHFFDEMNVRSIPPFSTRCDIFADKCNQELQPVTEFLIYKKCVEDYQGREVTRKISQISYIVFGIIGSILVVFGICYVWYRFQRFSDDNENVPQKNKNTTAPLLTLNNDLHV